MATQRKLQRITNILLICIIAIAVIIGGWITLPAYADTDIVAAFESTDALDDLKKSTIAGHAFNIDDYPHVEGGDMQIISFVEFGYSSSPAKLDDFGLYVYVYNPRDIAIDNTTRNKIQLTYGDVSRPVKFPLTFLNYSKQGGYEGRFYKYRVQLSVAERQAILLNIARSGRKYSISGIELVYKGVSTEYKCAQTYTYTGYAKGYGSELADTDTLSCVVDGFDTCIALDVHQTVYRSKGDFYNGEQSQLNSCYFRVPNRFFEEYGELSEIACEWWEYLTKPILVTSDSGAFSMVNGLHGGDLSNNKNFYYLYLMQSTVQTNCFWVDNAGVHYMTNCPNVDYENGDNNFSGFFNYVDVYRSPYKNFSAAFYTGSTKYSDYTVSGDELKSKLLSNSQYLGGEMYTDRYSASLFVDENRFNKALRGHTMGHNEKSITPNDQFGVSWNMVQKDFWDNFYHGYTLSTRYEEIEAFHFVTDADLSGNTASIARSLYVKEKDVADLKSEYSKAKKNDETLVLFRFSNSTYYSYPTVISGCSTSTKDAGEKLMDDAVDDFFDEKFSAYISLEVVFLDFDIISLTYTNDGVETVIPVVCSPTDVFSDVTPPLKNATSGKYDWKKIISIVLTVIIGLLILWLLSKFGLLPIIGSGIVFVVTAPYKLISNAIKRRKDKSNKNEE